jgi:hypothetical protein
MTPAAELALVVADLCESRGVSVRDLVDALERPVPMTVTGLLDYDTTQSTWFRADTPREAFTSGILLRATW